MRTKLSSSSTATALLATASLVVLVLVCNLYSNTGTVEARYLPTRSDKSEVETLKEIIRSLLIESATPNRQQQQTSFYQRQQPTRAYLQRRAAEMSVSSANGGDEQEALLASPFETESRSPFKPMNQRPDR